MRISSFSFHMRSTRALSYFPCNGLSRLLFLCLFSFFFFILFSFLSLPFSFSPRASPLDSHRVVLASSEHLCARSPSHLAFFFPLIILLFFPGGGSEEWEGDWAGHSFASCFFARLAFKSTRRLLFFRSSNSTAAPAATSTRARTRARTRSAASSWASGSTSPATVHPTTSDESERCSPRSSSDA